MSSLPDSPAPEACLYLGETPEAAAVYADWSDLIIRIRSGETEAVEELHQLIYKGVRFLLHRRLGVQDLDRRSHVTFLAIVQAIREGELREPRRLGSFARNILDRQAAKYIETLDRAQTEQLKTDQSSLQFSDWDQSPEQSEAFRDRHGMAVRVLREISARDREILRRFYFQEQDVSQICAELSLTETQFRLLMARAKARFARFYQTHRDWAISEPVTPPQYANGMTDFSARIGRLVPVVAHAVAVFGDENKASHWLTTRLPLLGDRSPSQLLETEDGVVLVEQILTRIEHNIPS